MKKILSKSIQFTLSMMVAVTMMAAGTACAGEADAASTEPVSIEPATQSDAGIDLEAMQQYLLALGFLDEAADELSRENMENAVANFKTAYGIEATGETDETMLEMLRMLAESIAAEPEDAEYTLTMFRNINILRYEDGKYYVEPNTVSDKTLESAEAALKALAVSFEDSTVVPAEDTRVLIAVNRETVSDVVSEKDLMMDGDDAFLDVVRLEKLAAKHDGLTVSDVDGNVITCTADGMTSDTGMVVTRTVDYDDFHIIISDTASRTMEDVLSGAIVETDADAISFRNIMIHRMADDSYEVQQNTVSERTLNEFRKAYTAIRYAYLHSTEIPTSDTETRILVDVDHLPESVTRDDLIYDEASDTYYITTREIQRISDETGEAVMVQDSEGNRVTVDRLGNTTTDTGNIMSQIVDTGTIKSAETKSTEAKPDTDTKTSKVIHHEAEYKTVHHDAVTHTVHHDAVTHTVNHPAETHEETIYTTVHHDATYETVHHDAIIASMWVEDTPDQIAYTLYITCTGCWEQWEVPDGMTDKQALKIWFDHCLEEHNGNAGYTWTSGPVTVISPGTGHYEDFVAVDAWDETVCTAEAWDEQVVNGTKTVTDKAAWVETVVDIAAWDEVIVDKEAWDEQVLVKEAWDEVVYP